MNYAAKQVLRQIGPTPAAIEGLVKVLANQNNEEGPQAAAELLGSYGSAAKAAIPALRRASSSSKWSVSNAAREAIEAIESGN